METITFAPRENAATDRLPHAAKLAKLVAIARDQLSSLASRASKRGVAVTFSVRTGQPYHEIATSAREQSSDLIVMATHGFTGIKHVVVGSTAERVVRHGPCTVLTVSTRGKSPLAAKLVPLKLKKIVVPIDFSNTSMNALPGATLLAHAFHAEIILVHVVEKFPIDFILGREQMNETIGPLIKQAKVDLQQMAGNLSQSTGIKVAAVVMVGKPFEGICQAARKLDADMIVLTTHGYTGLKHIWLGSTAERVVRHANCPVMAVR
jgi:nucleotide-binding universal stress UspA family protein